MYDRLTDITAGQDPPPCQILPWDTEFFGFRIARVETERLTRAWVEQIETWCRENEVQCLYLLAAADDAQTVELAEENAFHLVDVRVTLLYRAPGQVNASQFRTAGNLAVRPADPADVPALCQIARVSHRNSRFFFDPGFPRRRSEQLYETWITKSCQGYADIVYIAESEAVPVGYVSCHLDSETGTGRIGLTAVSGETRGKGVGQELVLQALDWFLAQGVQEVTVVTQARNCAAQRLYQRCGFLTHTVQLWYHKWYSYAGRGS